MEKLKWHTEKRKVNDLIPYENNPRIMTEKQKNDLQKSLEKFDLVEIPATDLDNKIIAGHQRLKIMQLLDRGEEEIDVRIPNRKLTDDEFREYNLRSNKNIGDWNLDMLANLDEDLLLDVGFEKGELDDIFGLDISEEFNIEKELEKLLKGRERRVSPGDIWQLGEHKLIIGDCTNKESWIHLFGNEKFDLMETDPPYLIEANKKRTIDGKRKIKVKTKSGFGYKKTREYQGLKLRGVPEYDEWLSIANEFQNPKGANIMIFENWKNTVNLWQALEKYWKIKNLIIWWLPNRNQGFGAKYKFFNKYDIAPLGGEGVLNEEYEKEMEEYLLDKGQKLLDTYEVIIYSQKGGSYWDRRKKTAWTKVTDHITHNAETEKSGGQNIIFGTKPIQILVPYIKILSPRNGIVAEPFCGSGSTIIACEIMKRRCRAIEIEPIYGEVILIRWEKFTGKKAVKIK